MKFSILAINYIALLSSKSLTVAATGNVRRVLNIERTLQDEAITASGMANEWTAVSTIDGAHSVQEEANRNLQGSVCTNYATVGDYITSYCTIYEDCTCTGEYSVKEDVSGSGCYHCSKPDGASCTDDHECMTRVSECVEGTCAPRQCPNTATRNETVTSSLCSYEACECSGEYSVKEDVSGDQCYHCAKPDGAACEDNHECKSSSTCNNGICGTKQCPHTATVTDNYMISSQCTYNECDCSGEYGVKEDLTGSGCYHCSKPNGAPCSANDECMNGISKCYNGICGALRCPLISQGRCTLDESCVCEDSSYPYKYNHTFSNGVQCYGCTASP